MEGNKSEHPSSALKADATLGQADPSHNQIKFAAGAGSKAQPILSKQYSMNTTNLGSGGASRQQVTMVKSPQQLGRPDQIQRGFQRHRAKSGVERADPRLKAKLGLN